MSIKKIALAVAAALLWVGSASAQATNQLSQYRDNATANIKKDPKDTIPKIWKKGMLINVNINQGSLTNWAAGGDKFSLSLSSLLNAYAFYKKGKHAWDNVADLGFGLTNTTTLGTRKADDHIDLTSKYGYDMGKHWYASLLANVRTQFSSGYLYTDSSSTLTSKFFAPANLLLSPGFDYKPTDKFSLFISPVTGRWIVVLDDSLSAQGAYGVDPGKHIKSQFGAYLTVNWIADISKDINFKTRLDLFSDYLEKPQNVYMFWTNMLTLKVNKYIAASVNVDMIYDDKARVFANPKTGTLGPRLQVKEVIGVGFSTTF
ncbi:Protein of unknown function [Chitinophaga costaii]|uniref:DUF3078 domain-containing protein n=1 Tax=Chitinophaga costaii TaxID=1335309 RepID=A0A1C4DS97_9BACT|nr:DUF3078 domain-containing protein [Chitinophaga costaii]PUZ27763.1 DUF3078 domain-containing protein [Chitinophaga costaii]SCC34120.1 Protein of unknown function [Chitinophaga costaii]